MKKKLLIILLLALGIFALYQNFSEDNSALKQNNQVRNIHSENLEKSPFKNTLKLSKSQRKAQGLTPNKFYEQEWELTMNPLLGRPTPEKLQPLRDSINAARLNTLAAGRVPGDAMNNGWVERGPNNVGGRTRAIMFDPNDASNETVFAGGVSGGLWKNTNISNPESSWQRVNVPENLAVSCITYDPNNSNVFYLGTGESYVGGDVNGSGVWKSDDAGATWTNVFGGITGDTSFQSASNISVNSPSDVAGDYLSYPTTAFGPEITSVISANIVLVDDGTGLPTEGCSALVNGAQISGNIALIRRGNCNFTQKVKNAQNAGAVGVIMMNNVVGQPIPMGGDDNTITIPSVMISKADGDILEASILAGSTMTGSLNPVSSSFTGNLVPGIQHINDIKVRDNNGVSEVYVAAGDGFYGSANATTYLGGPEFGLYKSTDNGNSWSLVSLQSLAGGVQYCPNDIEIGADNKIWVSTIDSYVFGEGGGTILSSTDGNSFSVEEVVADADRTQIAVSSSDPNKIYVLAEGTTAPVIMIKTEDGFSSTTNMTLPNDADTGISANDFTRGQAFYDLLLEVDPANDDIVYAGGIDLFKSFNSGTSWSQLSHWYGGFGYQEVHADQHALVFGNNSSSVMLVGNDGGIYYSSNAGVVLSPRDKDFNTSQFYTVGVAPTTAFNGDYFAGGLQDNGTQLFQNANSNGADSSVEAYGGDGAYTFFDQGDDKYFIRNYVYNSGINLFNLETNTNVTINNENASNGAFINPQALDSNLDILYSNYSNNLSTVIRRYSGIKSSSTLTSSDLTNSEFDSTPTALTVSPFTTTSSTLFVGTVLGDIFKVENADGSSPTWTELELNNFIVGSVSDIELGSNEDEIFVTIHNYGVENIWYTNDGGANWQTKEGNLPDLPVKSILRNPLNNEEVIIGTELGVWYTTNFSDANPTWNPAFNGMSNVKVLDLDLRDDNMVFAATYGRGIFSGQFSFDPNGDDDNDGVVNGVDNCPSVANADQSDVDNNGIGDVCQDTDQDGILDINDNCPTIANPDQLDSNNDGVGDVCQDSDGDGVVDSIDNCVDTPNPNQEDVNNNGIGDICDTSYAAQDNISIEVVSETCEGQDNGKININVNETYVTYTVTVNGPGTNISEQLTTNNLTIENLSVGGPYTVCVSVNEYDHVQCSEVSVEAAETIELELIEQNNGEDIEVNMYRGTAPYTVTLNGEVILITSQDNIILENLKSGLLEIKTAQACEGTFAKQINIIEFKATPNPVVDNLKVILPNGLDANALPVNVYDINGRVVYSNSFDVANNKEIYIPFQSLRSGVYFVNIQSEKAPKTIKIIKK